jgi:type III pantothenate kinase
VNPVNHPSAMPLVGVDVGNSRTKFALFAGDLNDAGGLPTPERTLDFSGSESDFDQVTAWLGPQRVEKVAWRIASVNRPNSTRLIDWLREQGATHNTRLVTSRDLPLKIELPRPDMVGIDRLLGAVGANVLRSPSRPAVVVDLGTAITVDLVSVEGSFLGGAILPGIGLSARALHEFTDVLPLLSIDALAHPPLPVGKSTVDAMLAGLFWGAVGAARELIAQFSSANSSEPQVFLTGGAAASVAPLLASDCLHVPHLVLGGMACALRGES